MIKTPKIPLFSDVSFRRVFLRFVAIAVLYGVIPLFFLRQDLHVSVFSLVLFYLFLAGSISYLLYRHSVARSQLEHHLEDFQERINVLRDACTKDARLRDAIQEKTARYDSLKHIIEQINQSLDSEAITDALCAIAFTQIARERGTVELYLVDPQAQQLGLFKTRKEDKKLVVKAKQGDLFDQWVMRHVSPLIVEDARKDFRFDSDRACAVDERPIGSVISAPFVSQNKFLGILRLDHKQPGMFTQDDLRFLVTVSDIGAVALENSELFQRTQHLAIHDGLTLLYTKGYLLDRMRDEFKRCIRRSAPLSFLMLDIDYFKQYNDKFGHTAGDIVLKAISGIMRNVFSSASAIIGRFGGEEFCVVLPDVDKDKAFALAQQLREAIEREKIVLRRQETSVTVSIGVAALPADAADTDELLQKADRALYDAKQRGRNRVSLYGAES